MDSYENLPLHQQTMKQTITVTNPCNSPRYLQLFNVSNFSNGNSIVETLHFDPILPNSTTEIDTNKPTKTTTTFHPIA